MTREEVIINNPEEIKELAGILKKNIGQILNIGAYKVRSNNLEEKDYFENWAVIRDVFYDHDKDSTFGRVKVAIFQNESPKLEEFHIGFITQIADLNMNLLYYRDRPTRVRTTQGKK